MPLTPLQEAVQIGDTHQMEKLLKEGWDPNDAAEDTLLPISIAYQNKDLNSLLLLLKYGANSYFDQDQTCLSLIMEALFAKVHDHPNHDGICLGEGESSMEAFLLGDDEVNNYYQRLRKLDEILIHAQVEVLENYIMLLSQATSISDVTASNLNDRNYNSEIFFDLFIQLTRESINSQLDIGKNRDQTTIDINAFVNKMELYQYDQFHKDKFPEVADKYAHELPTLAYNSSIALEGRGGIKHVAQLEDEFTLASIEEFMLNLKESTRDVACRFYINLACYEHSIYVGFDPLKGRWLFHDINKLKVRDGQNNNNNAYASILPMYIDKNNISLLAQKIYASFRALRPENTKPMKIEINVFTAAYNNEQDYKHANESEIKSNVDILRTKLEEYNPTQKQTSSFYDQLELADSANKIFKSEKDETPNNSSTSSEIDKIKATTPKST